MNAVVPVTLTNEEDSFALAVIEYGGNLGAAWRAVFGDHSRAAGKAREMLTRPEIAKRIQQLSVAVEEHAYISLGSHLTKLAEIRDLAIATDQLKTALGAEKARGEAAGFYTGKLTDPDAPNEGKAAVNIFIGANTPSNVQDWATKHGKTPIIIENPT